MWGKPSNGIESKYLLTGMARCGRCGGALTARSRSHGGHRVIFYHCLTNVQRGRAVCDNDLAVPLRDADEAVLAALEADILRPEVLTAALQEALVRLDRPAADVEADRARLQNTLTRLQAELVRLTEVVVSGGHLPSIVAAITERETQRCRAEEELAALDQLERTRGLDLRRVEQDFRTKLADWRGLLARHVAQARQALRCLVPERLTFTPKTDEGQRFYAFEGMAVLDRFLTGIALPKALVAPRDSNPCLSRDRVLLAIIVGCSLFSSDRIDGTKTHRRFRREFADLLIRDFGVDSGEITWAGESCWRPMRPAR